MFEVLKAVFGAVKNRLAALGERIFSSELITETAMGASVGCVGIGLAALAMPIPTLAKVLIGIASFSVPVVVGLAGAAKLSTDSLPKNLVESGLDDDSEDTFKQKLRKLAVNKYTKNFKKVPEENPGFIQEVLDDPVYEEVKAGLEDGSIEVSEDIEDDSVEISSEDLMDLIADASANTSVNVDIDDDDIVDMRDIMDESEEDEPIVDMRDIKDDTVQAREVIVDDHQNGGKTKVTYNGRNSTIDNSSPSKRTKEKLQITQKRLIESSM